MLEDSLYFLHGLGCSKVLTAHSALLIKKKGKSPAGVENYKLASAPLSTRQIWTAIQHDGPNHLGLWLIRRRRFRCRTSLPGTRR